MKKTKLTRSLLAACSIVALTAVMYGCSSGISQSEADRQAAEAAAAAAAAAQAEAEAAAAAAAAKAEAEAAAAAAAAKAEADRLAAIEAARQAIASAETAEAAQAAKDAVNDIATATEAAGLQADVDARVAALAMMAREAAQKMALSDAAGMIDTSDLSTQAAVDAARAAIVMLRGALAAADDVSDADKAMYMSMLDDAVMAVDAAQGGIDTATRRMNQMTALSDASDALQAALTALAGQAPTQEQIDAASAALADLNSAIEGAADLTAGETATYQREADNAAAPISTAQTSLDDAEEKAEEERQKAEAEAAEKAAAAMAATAAKLHAGISAPTATDTDTADTADAVGTRFARHADATTDATEITAGTASASDIRVSRSDSDTFLSEDKKTTVAALHGWEGKRYTAEPENAGTYEAMVYSNVGEPTMGKKFGGATANDEYEYALTNGAISIDTTAAATPASRVGGSSFTHSSGVKRFPLPEGNPLGQTNVQIPGSFHGVSGTYTCAPAAAVCAANVAAEGFQLGTVPSATDAAFTDGGGTWTFTPSNAEARVTEMPDTVYASYGWWLHTAANGDLTASAFVADKGDVPDAAGLGTLQGTATYMGGAVGKYALSSTTGGTNDAGHFTADATLNADFSDNSITGTIDNFMGADGMSREWSVELKEAAVAATGGITRTEANDTVWTIDGTAAAASGDWSGSLQNNGDDGVPQVATGTFYTEYGTAGKMVGAFGANKQ